MWYGELAALEDLQNYTICVKEKDGIRNMKFKTDIDLENLVYVKQCESIYQSNLIKQGEYVLYCNIVINKKDIFHDIL